MENEIFQTPGIQTCFISTRKERQPFLSSLSPPLHLTLWWGRVRGGSGELQGPVVA